MAQPSTEVNAMSSKCGRLDFAKFGADPVRLVRIPEHLPIDQQTHPPQQAQRHSLPNLPVPFWRQPDHSGHLHALDRVRRAQRVHLKRLFGLLQQAAYLRLPSGHLALPSHQRRDHQRNHLHRQSASVH